MIVSNSSPLIVLGKMGELRLLKKCFSKVFISREVYSEIKIKEDNIETKSLEKAINENWIVVEKIIVNENIDTKNLGKGEKEAISLADRHKCVLLIDDDNARKYASLLDVECHGTLYVLYLAVLKEFIDKNRAKNLFKKMINNSFYVSTDVYAMFLELLGKL